MNLPPLHPIAVHIPLILIPLSVAADWAGWAGRQPTAGVLGRWSLLLGWIGLIPVVLFGYFDMSRAPASAAAEAVHPYIELHMRLGWVLLVAVTLLGVWRLRLNLGRTRGHRAYLVCAVLVLAATVFQGWFGGELVYTLGAGVSPADQSVRRNPQAAHQRMANLREALGRVPGLDVEEGEKDAKDRSEPARRAGGDEGAGASANR
ncbi:MAG TPA: DUF2231 domain-containing protein [Opitutus sp.]|nr:DUF2231 domain-containing protein [Opitutus sp.]